MLNPIIRGLEREMEYLPDGPWLWSSFSRHCEYLLAVSDYVAEDYRDNLDDFVEKHPTLEPRFQAHDEALRALERSVEAAYDRLATSADGEQFRRAMKLEIDRSGTQTPDALTYCASYLASGVRELSSQYGTQEAYNRATEARVAGERIIVEERARARAAATRLRDIGEALIRDLRRLRTQLADQFGARIQPVD